MTLCHARTPKISDASESGNANPGKNACCLCGHGDGLLIANYSVSGKPLGVEITAPQAVPLDRLHQLLTELGEPPLAEQDYRPALAA